MKAAVVYYSHSGNVKALAEQIARALEAPLFPLVPEKPLKGTGFGSILKGGGQVVTGQKPALKELPDLSSYDRVLFGTPVWAGKCAAPAFTFLSSGALAGKEVAVFTASGGGNNKKALEQIAAFTGRILCSASFVDQAVPASSGNEDKLDAFLKEIKG